ncbi:MAG: endo-1,4-beta-xylanase, partial [Planctomycetota bacterium]
PAGLLRDDMTPKPAYDELKRLIKGQWWTKTQATVGSEGQARFRGFFGQYEVTARAGGRTLTGTFWFDKRTRGAMEVRLTV